MAYQILPSTPPGSVSLCCAECSAPIGYDVPVGEYVDRYAELEHWRCPSCRVTSRPLPQPHKLVTIELPPGTRINADWWREGRNQCFILRGDRHPFSDDGRLWDLLHLQGADHAALDGAIAAASRRYWQLFLRSPKLPRALLYKPVNATSGWVDPAMDRRKIA